MKRKADSLHNSTNPKKVNKPNWLHHSNYWHYEPKSQSLSLLDPLHHNLNNFIVIPRTKDLSQYNRKSVRDIYDMLKDTEQDLSEDDLMYSALNIVRKIIKREMKDDKDANEILDMFPEREQESPFERYIGILEYGNGGFLITEGGVSWRYGEEESDQQRMVCVVCGEMKDEDDVMLCPCCSRMVCDDCVEWNDECDMCQECAESR